MTITLTGSARETVQTDAAGFFALPALALGGGYTVTPSGSGLTFTPASRAFTAVKGNQVSDFTSSGGAMVPAAPTNLAATAGNAQVALTWTASSGATSYTVLRATVSGGPYTSVATGVTTTSFTNTGLSNGTTYFFVVRAVNGAGTSGNSNQASATPTAGTMVPPAPTNLTATAGNAQVALAWTASSGATSYTVLRATVSGGPYTSVATGLTTTSFTNTGLSNGTTYFFVVRAVNSAGTSGNSNQASATPSAGGSTPCAGLCTGPTVFSTSNFQSGNLGTAARCFETTASLSAGGNCSNMMSRTLNINAGAAQNCTGWTLPAKRNNGYCIQIAGAPDYASFATW